MRPIARLIALTLFVGCTDPASMLPPQSEQTTTSQPNAAPPSTPSVPQANGSTSPQTNATSPRTASTPPESTVADPATEPTGIAAVQQAAPPGRPRSIIGQFTSDVVDLHEAMQQHPELRVVEDKFTGSDPLSVATEAYVTVRAKASMLGMKADLERHKVVNEGPPTYAEFIDMMKRNRITFTQLPSYRVYAYDSKEGKLVILEEPHE